MSYNKTDMLVHHFFFIKLRSEVKVTVAEKCNIIQSQNQDAPTQEV